MGKLIIHIGPPKTATTSFQIFFQELENDSFKYLGVYQPRTADFAKKENLFRNNVYTYIDGSSNNIKSKQIEKEIKGILDTYEFVLFSEEMILHKPDWKSKVHRLHELFGSFDPYIVFCIRNPNHALQSYYQETYSYLPKPLKNSYKKFEKSVFAEVYNYSLIYNTLKNSGFQNIRWFEFDQLIANGISFDQIFIQNKKFSNKKIIVTEQNASVKKRSKRVITYDSFSEQHKMIIRGVNFFKKIGFKTFYKFLRNLFIHKKEFNPVLNSELQRQFESDLEMLNSIYSR